MMHSLGHGKTDPLGGRNHIRNTNACVQSGNSENWKPLRPEPANSHDDIASWHKLARWAVMYNMGQLQLVVTAP
jgi:hypothetical protein